MSEQGFSTRAIHAGQDADPTTGATVVPIYATSTYTQAAPGTAQGLRIFAQRQSDRARPRNLPRRPRRRRARPGLRLRPGGDHRGARPAQARRRSRGGGRSLRRHLSAARTRLQAVGPGRHATPTIPARTAFAKIITPKTKLVWIETPTNPLLQIVDIAAIAELAHKAGAMLAVDNTFASPYLQQPLKLGADLVVHSTTKYLGGHSDVVGGAVIGRKDLLTPIAFYQNAAGGVPGPFDSWLTLRGIKTLAVRMERHCANARQLADWLAQAAGGRTRLLSRPGRAIRATSSRRSRCATSAA